MRILAIITLIMFYAVYIGKMILQRRKGIQTDQIAKGKAKNSTFYTECFMKVATYLVVVVEVISILSMEQTSCFIVNILGIVLGIVGDIVFALAVITMKDSWRAGIAQNDKTEMITCGIYQFSRNPAFLGFDLVYVGILFMYFNWGLLICTIFAMVMLHLQILQEETYLSKVFGETYLEYKNKVRRYLGRRDKKKL